MFASLTPDPIDASRLETAQRIQRHGFVVELIGFGVCSIPGCVCGPDPEPWAYTVGCAELGHPELVMLGCCMEHSHSSINRVMSAFRAGDPLAVGDRAGREIDGVRLALEHVPDEWLLTDIDRMASWFDFYTAGRTEIALPPVAQVFVVNDDGCFPWDEFGSDVPILLDEPFDHPRRPSRSIRRARAERGRNQRHRRR